jgi:hypothetical protein
MSSVRLVREINVGHLISIFGMVFTLIVFLVRTDGRIETNELTLGRVIELQEQMIRDVSDLKEFKIRQEIITNMDKNLFADE